MADTNLDTALSAAKRKDYWQLERCQESVRRPTTSESKQCVTALRRIKNCRTVSARPRPFLQPSPIRAGWEWVCASAVRLQKAMAGDCGCKPTQMPARRFS